MIEDNIELTNAHIHDNSIYTTVRTKNVSYNEVLTGEINIWSENLKGHVCDGQNMNSLG